MTFHELIRTAVMLHNWMVENGHSPLEATIDASLESPKLSSVQLTVGCSRCDVKAGYDTGLGDRYGHGTFDVLQRCKDATHATP